MRAHTWLAVLLVVSGCYHVRIKTDPVSATVGLVGDKTIQDGRVKVYPLAGRQVQVSATGHRSQTFPVRWRALGWLRRSHEIEVLLVEEHGGAGSAQ